MEGGIAELLEMPSDISLTVARENVPGLEGLEDLSRGILENSEKTSGDLYPDVVLHIKCDDKHPPCVITALKPLQAVCFYIVRLLSGSG